MGLSDAFALGVRCVLTLQSNTVQSEPFGCAQASLVEAQSTRTPFDKLRANGVAHVVAGQSPQHIEGTGDQPAPDFAISLFRFIIMTYPPS